jgi:hypothetical protein
VPTLANSCLTFYYRPGNALLLMNDAGTDWLPGLLGSGGTLQNRQCAIALDAGTTAVSSGATLTLTLSMTFAPSFAGAKTIVMYAWNANFVDTGGWQPRGGWTVPTPPVTADSVTPNAGSGRSQSFALKYSDAVSATNLVRTWVWFHPAAPTLANSCLAFYYQPANTLYLLDAAGGSWLTGVVGSGGTLQNSQCSIALDGGTDVSVSGRTLTLTLAMTFTPAFAGDKIVQMFAEHTSGADTGSWQIRGSWIIP